MIELRKRVLSSGFVVLEYRYKQFIGLDLGFDGMGESGSETFSETEWAAVPYVNETGEPIQMNEETRDGNNDRPA